MNIKQLVDTYLDQIEIEDTNYVPMDDSAPDAAYILLNIPIAMLQEYLKLKGQNKELPDGAEFWKETGLREKLKNSGKCVNHGHEPLEDILEFLGGDVQGEYQRLNSKERIKLAINEIPELY